METWSSSGFIGLCLSVKTIWRKAALKKGFPAFLLSTHVPVWILLGPPLSLLGWTIHAKPHDLQCSHMIVLKLEKYCAGWNLIKTWAIEQDNKNCISRRETEGRNEKGSFHCLKEKYTNIAGIEDGTEKESTHSVPDLKKTNKCYSSSMFDGHELRINQSIS